MIYSKFGSRLTPISKSEDASGRFTLQATAEDTTEVREYLLTDLKADDGAAEINDVVAKLPMKVAAKKPIPRRSIRPNG